MYKTIAALVAILVFPTGVNKEKLDEYFQVLRAHDAFMGNIAVYEQGVKKYAVATGYARLDPETRAGESTMYHLGSISKTYTATLVLKAVEEGKLQLSQTIESFFPALQNADRITIAQLLNHHSGIHNVTSDAKFMEWRTRAQSEEDMLSHIMRGGVDFEPGAQAQYSNSNYILLSYLLEHTYKKPYGALLEQKIIEPLDLEHTRFGNPAQPSTATKSYVYEDGWVEFPPTDMSVPMGAGGIVASASDLAKFVEALFTGKLISTASLEKMKTQQDDYGMGLFRRDFGERVGYGHDGKIDGFGTVFYYFPEEKVTYVLLSNGEVYPLEKIHTDVLSGVFNEPFEIPAFYDVRAEELTLYLGTYTSETNPLVIHISKKENKLLAQPEGQEVYAMEATAQHHFRHDMAGVTLEFVPAEHRMIMKQGGNTWVFTKKN